MFRATNSNASGKGPFMNLENFQTSELGFELAYILQFSREKRILEIALYGTPYENALIKITNWDRFNLYPDLPEKIDEILNRVRSLDAISGGSTDNIFYFKGLYQQTRGLRLMIECRIEKPEIHLIYENRLDQLFEAIKQNDLPTIKQLIEDGIDPNHPRLFGMSDYIRTQYALIEAATQGNFETVQFLVQHGARVNVQDKWDGETPLICAFFSRDAEKIDPIVKYLVDCGADINAVGGFCESALTQAMHKDNQEMVKFLVSRGADVNIELSIDENETRSKPLHAAIFDKRTSMVELLISLGARLDLEDSLGMLPLHTAVDENNKDICLILLKTGADINASSSYGKTPLQLAQRNDNAEMAEFLKKHGAKNLIWQLP